MPYRIRLTIRPTTAADNITHLRIDGTDPLGPGELLHWLDLDLAAVHEAAAAGATLELEAEIHDRDEVAAMPPEEMAKKHFRLRLAE
jgi:hypothetical protein